MIANWLFMPIYGVLTEGGTVTADSVFISANNLHSDCLSGLVDGKFIPWVSAAGSTKCIAHNEPTTPHSWFNIDMGAKTIVQTVLVIDYEMCCTDRIFGTDLYVGDNSLPFMNTPCGASPLSSGVYSCGGKVG